ncbi:MAG TPA: nucleotide sugar dehydrogenase [Allosphingosinicella sp.]|uniref:nucleotide sugar dehydrogenase n=1 Tax=Allosphingosinicella sp. TaxID=2823234 RepID=UPI002ED84CDD
MPLPTRILDQNVCILGLGYVGLTLGVAMADAGFRVHGIERRQDVVDLLKEGKAHFWEPRLDDKLKRVVEKGSFTFSTDVDPGFPATVYILTVGTPLGKDGKASLEAVERASRQVASVMPEDALVILRSTVKLGTARNVVAPVLAERGRRYEIAVCPERTLEGKALIELNELPQIIGSDDADTRQRCVQLFGALTPTTIALSSLEAAELTKLVDNTYRDVMFAFANEIAQLCGHAGLSAHEIISAGRLGYPRTNVALPGPVGGPCLEKDPHILVESARSYGVTMGITAAARQMNEVQPAETVRLMKEAFEAAGGGASPKIALCGLAFKGVPPTDDLRGTMATPILEALRAAFPDGSFVGYDPVVPEPAARGFFGIDTAPTLQDACEGASIAVIANNHPTFQRMELPALAAIMATPGIVYDYWNMHNRETEGLPTGVRYLSLGSERKEA